MTRSRHGSQLPFRESTFELVIAVEAHFWWPNLPTDMREVFRVLKADGKLIVIAEIYKGANTAVAKLVDKSASQAGMKMLDIDEHRELFARAMPTKRALQEKAHRVGEPLHKRKPSPKSA